jgi:hypothetical protein
MSAKAKKPVVKKKKKAEKDEEGLSTEEQTIFLTRQVEALKLQLVKSDNKSTLAEGVVREIRQKLFDLQKDYEDEKKRTYALASDMTRQYKRKVEDMMREKSEEEQLRLQVEDKLAALQLQKEQMERDMLQRLSLKEAEILEQKNKMDEMAHEFGQMLKATLDKMSEKIEITNECVQQHKRQIGDLSEIGGRASFIELTFAVRCCLFLPVGTSLPATLHKCVRSKTSTSVSTRSNNPPPLRIAPFTVEAFDVLLLSCAAAVGSLCQHASAAAACLLFARACNLLFRSTVIQNHVDLRNPQLAQPSKFANSRSSQAFAARAPARAILQA